MAVPQELFPVLTDALGACKSLFLLLQYNCNKLLVVGADRYGSVKGFGFCDSGNKSHLQSKGF